MKYNKEKVKDLLLGNINYKKKHRGLPVPKTLQSNWNNWCDMKEDYLSKIPPVKMTTQQINLAVIKKHFDHKNDIPLLMWVNS